MTEFDGPAGEHTPAAGDDTARPTAEALAALPTKVRVHALARVVGVSSRELLAVLARLGVGARSAQSSVDRDTVAQVVDDLFQSARPDASETVAPADEATPTAETPAPSGTPVPDDDAAVDLGGETDLPAVVPPPSGASPAVPAPMFLAPESESSRPRRRRGTRTDGPVTPDTSEGAGGSAATTDGAEPPTTTTTTRRRRGRGAARDEANGGAAETGPEASEASEASETDGAGAGTDDTTDTTDTTTGPEGAEHEDDDSARRRRRRGRRGRGRGRGADDGEPGDDTEDSDEASGESDDSGDTGEGDGDSGDGDDAEGSSGSRRRRRRRRRSSDNGADASDGDSGDGDGSDPPNTVTHVRDRTDRSASDEVKGVKGSTRLEAKRQRRRDGRDAGRRRPPILSESEFLARREAVERTMVVRQQAGRSQIGVLEDDVLVEHFVAGDGQNSMVGNVYLGRVQNVLPSMEAAFVDIGRGRNAVLYAGEVNWDASGLEGKQRKIEQALSSGDQVLVQVTKDPVGHKGARLTTQISLPGRFLVFVPAGGATGISRKLPDNERKRLKEILKRIVPDESGVIIRTAAEGVSEPDLERDVRRLTAQWEIIERKAAEAKRAKGNAPTLVYEEPDLLIRVVRDMFNEDFSSLVVSGDRAHDTLEGYLSHVAPELSARMSRHTGPQDVFAAYRIDEQLAKALDRKVWLPSGGTLVIDRTEAMTVVDVNTGKFTGSGGNLEETVTRNNIEAAEEIVRQLRLRDIGGMIVIDFIDMVLESNRDLVLRRLTECLGRDRTRHQVSEVTSLGLVQMTRKRVGQGLLDEFSSTCEHCRGRGVLVSTEPVIADAGSSNGSGARSDGDAAPGGGSGGGAGANGASANGSGSGGSGGGSGRRRGRRRSAQSDGGSPSEVTPVATEPADTEATDVEDATTETASPGPESPTTEAPTTESPAAEAPVEVAAHDAVVTEATADEVALETDLAEHTGGEAPEAQQAEPAETGAPEAGEPAGHGGETPAVALEADLSEQTGDAEVGSEPRLTSADEAAGRSGTRGSEPAPEPEPAPAPEPAPEPARASRPRRRRAASRPAGPPPGSNGDAATAGADGGDEVLSGATVR